MEEETKHIVLVFETLNSLSYWFSYMTNYLRKNEVLLNVFRSTRSMMFKNQVVKFVVKNESIARYVKGRRNLSIIGGIEYDFEKDFEGTFNKIFKI